MIFYYSTCVNVTVGCCTRVDTLVRLYVGVVVLGFSLLELLLLDGAPVHTGKRFESGGQWSLAHALVYLGVAG